MGKVAVVVGRFQTPILHKGHLTLLKHARDRCQHLILVIACSRIKEEANPLDFDTRKLMLRQWAEEYRQQSKYDPEVTIVPIVDTGHRYTGDKQWSTKLDNIIDTIMGPSQGEVMLYGGRDSFHKYYSGIYSYEEIPELDGNYTATDFRKAARPLKTADFRSGVIYGQNTQWDKAVPVVDIAVWTKVGPGHCIAMGKRAEGMPWQFPGGYVDPTDKSFEHAAIREFHEECGPNLELGGVHNLNYIGSSQIDDWRYEKSEDKMLGSLFMVKAVWGHLKASDEFGIVEWVSIDTDPSEIRDVHREYFEKAVILIKATLDDEVKTKHSS